MKVAVVYGGYSSEREASAENAEHIGAALQKKGCEVCMIPYEKDLIATLKEAQADIVYVCVQGRGHGDGTIQAMLEHEGIPFTGSGAHAAALINDKIVSKLLFERLGLPTPRWQILTKEAYADGSFDAAAFGYPFVAKAPSEGGSFGIALIHDKQETERIEEVFAYEAPILIEDFIAGDFYTIGILEQDGALHTLPCVQGIELDAAGENTDPDSLKVFTGDYTAREAGLPKPLLQEMAEMAKTVFRGIGARGVARIDFMVSRQEQKPYVLEINAVPGLKPKSLLPKEAALAGIPYEELINGILLQAWQAWNEDQDKVAETSRKEQGSKGQAQDKAQKKGGIQSC